MMSTSPSPATPATVTAGPTDSAGSATSERNSTRYTPGATSSPMPSQAVNPAFQPITDAL